MRNFNLLLTALIEFTITVNAQWTGQSTGLSSVGPYDLLQVYFNDTNTGYVVGKAVTFLKTINGETNRTALTS